MPQAMRPVSNIILQWSTRAELSHYVSRR